MTTTISLDGRPPRLANLLPRLGFAMASLAMVIADFAAVSIATAGPRPAAGAEIRYTPDTREVTLRTAFGDPQIGSLIGAHPANFLVYEDGRRQSEVSIAVEHAPISVGVLLENGGRYRALNEILADHVSNAARTLLDEFTSVDKVAVWKYAGSIEPLATEPRPAAGLSHVLDNPPLPPLSEVNFRDASIAAVHQMQAMSGHRPWLCCPRVLTPSVKRAWPRH